MFIAENTTTKKFRTAINEVFAKPQVFNPEE